ncbi:hypothetical protein BDM02DRAFT_3188829 [Thelephora ganbajun]|uniref:Uncharacterized protein n=1 Tax=Thelephora ganbajun TaxID=370292 RepID=A0ACB6ZA00_THEGA|nr:hypothetical protein BDM02DRAFT_3188829 [Thelephora ganbajun]
MSSFKSNVVRGVAAPMGSDLTLTDLLSIGLVNWEGANLGVDCAQDGMCYATTVTERLLSRLEIVEGQVTTQANALQLQVSGLDSLLNQRSKDHCFLLAQAATLEQEVEVLMQTVAQLEGEFGILLARVEALEWTTPSAYLSVEDLFCQGAGGEVEEMDSDAAWELGLHPDFSALVDRPDPVDTSAPLFP